MGKVVFAPLKIFNNCFLDLTLGMHALQAFD